MRLRVRDVDTKARDREASPWEERDEHEGDRQRAESPFLEL